jgi:DNA-binding NtrC family response regulator
MSVCVVSEANIMARILVIEKEGRTQALFRCKLSADVKVKSVSCVEAAIDKLANHKFDLIVWSLAEKAGESTCRELSAKVVGTRMIVLAEPGNFDDALFAPVHVCGKDRSLSDEELISLVESHLPFDITGGANQLLSDEVSVPIEFEGLIAVGLPMRAVIRRIMDAAAVDIPVLITGETGTGKDLIAAAIHKRSPRMNHPYIPVNTGAIARELIASELFGHERGAFTGAQETRPGIFEQADHGTVFLDEIATMDEKSQVSLLRVLEEKTFRRVGGSKNIGVDVRIIAATNEDLEKNVAEKRFREDLFYRLNVFHINVPPLRARLPGAITVLTDHFVARFAAVYGKDIERVSSETYRLLRRYPWPGNVRELKNVIQTALLMADGKELKPEFIPERIRHAVAGSDGRSEPTCSFRVGASLRTVQKEFIRVTLSHMGGNKKLAASILGISRRALYNKMKNLNLG